MSETVIEYVLRRLKDIGIDAIFGVPGDFAFPVQDAIVNDGSNTPYHLVLTSNQTGASGSLQISVQGDSGIASLLTYPPGTGDTITQEGAGGADREC